MGSYEINELPELDKDKLIEILTDELPVLRAKIGISQGDISNIIGISRQTYNAIETKKEKNVMEYFLVINTIYGYNEKTTDYVENIGAFTPSLKRILNVNRRTREDQ